MVILSGKVSKILSISTAISIAGFLATADKGQAFQIVTTVDGCKVWTNDQGDALIRRSGNRLMLRQPCGNGLLANPKERYTSHLSGQSFIVNDQTEGAIAVYRWDGGTGLVQTSRRLIYNDKSSRSKVSTYNPN